MTGQCCGMALFGIALFGLAPFGTALGGRSGSSS
jgi:hypothetical protein